MVYEPKRCVGCNKPLGYRNTSGKCRSCQLNQGKGTGKGFILPLKYEERILAYQQRAEDNLPLFSAEDEWAR